MSSPILSIRQLILLATVIIVLGASPTRGQIMYNSLEDVYTQNFDSLSATGSSFTWLDNSTLPGWYAANTGSVGFNPAGVTTGSTTTGNLYSFGSSGSADRALGSIGSGSSNAGGFYYGIRFVNNTGVTINAVTISYVGEQWRNSAAAGQTVTFQYSLSATGIKTGSYTGVPSLDFTSPITGGTAGALNGNATANRVAVGPVTITDIYWPPNTALWLRWSDPDHAGFDHGLAIDSFSFQAARADPQYGPPAGYYSSAQGLFGHDLEVTLHNIISPHTIIPDTSSMTTDLWGAIKLLDEDPFDSTKVKLFYSTSSALKTDSGVSWNRDRLWPRSRGIEDSGPDNTDLFNIRAASAAVSSARGNKLFDNSNPLDPNYHMPAHVNAGPDTSSDTDSWQPPADQRGDVARALFYMQVRYDGNPLMDPNTTDLALANTIVNASNMGVLSTLLQWHRADPVSDEERRRNQLIYAQFQHNRNPFIDNPDFAEALFNELERSLEDEDLDGMPSLWEQANNFAPSNAADAAQDSDGDGFTNFEEYWMGSDPHNAGSPTVIVVDANYTGPVENGSAANPYKRIQSAIDAVPTSELRAIVVKPGTYGERPYANGKRRLHLFGQAGAAQTIIDGQQVNSSVVRLYDFDKATFAGFTVKNALTDWTGGGLRIEAPSGAVLIDSNILTNNTTTASGSTAGGGGLYLKTAIGSRVINNFITNNHAQRGGGVLFAGGDTEFWHNTVAFNQATGGLGGGLSALIGVKPDVRNNIISSNAGTGSNADVHQLASITGAHNLTQILPVGSTGDTRDPKFVAPAQNDYHIAIDSPARNNAMPVPVTIDFDWDGRPETPKARADIGADEVAVVDGDHNGVPDYWELDRYASTLGHQLDDYDSDGLTNAAEFQLGTDPDVYDTDSDGLPDGWEVANGLTPLQNDANLDLDGDGLSNLQEFGHGTKANVVDTDSDGMPDGWEVANGLNPLQNDAALDHDGDGLSNLEEFNRGTNASNPDTDGDGLLDGWEVANHLNPLSSDTDGDGMPDGWEVTNGTNQLVVDGSLDPDGDGLTNVQEFQLGTNPRDSDTDHDGMPDGWEVTNGFNPLVNDGSGDADNDGLTNSQEYQRGTNPHNPDSDGDTMFDGWEVANRLNPLANDGSGDADNDGLTNLQEYQQGTNPRVADTDGDVMPDGWEVAHGFNPLVNDGPVSIAAGEYHTLVAGSSGCVWAWGLNSSGQLGDNTLADRARPIQVTGLRGVIAVSAGAYHSLALRGDGTVVAWGQNSLGQLGNGSFADSPVYVPVSFPANVRIVAIASGSYHNLALADNGKVYAWGLNSDGQLGDGTTLTRNQPVPISNTVELQVHAIAAGGYHSVAMMTPALVLGWGANFYGALGAVNTTDPRSLTPRAIQLNSNVGIAGIAAGAYHTMAIGSDGSARALGWNGYGELGDGSNSTRSSAAPIAGVTGITYLAGSETLSGHCLALTSNGLVWSWGGGVFGQLGTLPKQDRSLALPVATLPRMVKMAAGGFHSVSVSADGSVYLWGDNAFGQLGNGSHFEADEPSKIPDFYLIPTLDDTDQDNLPDSWERRYFGGLNQSGDGDPDGDGRANLREHQLSKDPTDSDNPQIDPIVSSSQLVQISTRASVGAGDNAMIAGFIIQGTVPKKVIVRAIGPSLTAFGVPDALQDTTLELHAPTGATIGVNDNWRDTQEQEINNTGVAPSDNRESAIVQTLSPGAYTAIIRGKDNATGVALIEVYDLTGGTSSYFANISTRALVKTGDNVMIAGFIITGSGVIDTVLRGIGPSLATHGVEGALQDPVLKLFGSDPMTPLAQNDNWKVALNPDGSANSQAPSQEGAVRSTGLPPEDERESVIVKTLQPGQYTAVISGKNNTTGIALVEVFDVTARSNGMPGTTFTFTLDASYATSAGVYTADDHLIRTLWRNDTYGPGRITRSWDGIDDDGNPVDPHGTYKVKVLSHNTKYVWDGVVGNTSNSDLGPIHSAQVFTTSLAIGDIPLNGTTTDFDAFYAVPEGEGFPPLRRFNTGSPQTVFNVLEPDARINVDHVATDGNRVYFINRGSGFSIGLPGFVGAKKLADTAFDGFSSGQSIPPLPPPGQSDDNGDQPRYLGCIEVSPSPHPNVNRATGLAVQKNGNILAVSHAGLNLIRLFNKTSGDPRGTIAVTNPKELAMTPAVATGDDELWVLSENADGSPVVIHYNDLSGQAGGPRMVGTINGLSKPAAITASRSNRGGVIIADGGTDQRLKFYGPEVDPVTHEHLQYRSPYPAVPGGYKARGPEVTHDKFQFEIGAHEAPEIRTVLAQMPDSTIWVGDGATSRLLRLNVETGELKDYVMFLAHNNGAVADPTTPTRLIGDGWLEFAVDYTKPLHEVDPTAPVELRRPWVLKKNWAAGLDIKYFGGITEGIHELTTLSNGRVYGTITDYSMGQRKVVVELPSAINQGLRICKVAAVPGAADLFLNNMETGAGKVQPPDFEKDGSLRYLRVEGGRVNWYQQDLDHSQPFDQDGNPHWAAERPLASVPFRNEDPVFLSEGSIRQIHFPITSSNVLVTFDQSHALQFTPAASSGSPSPTPGAPLDKLPGPPLRPELWKHLGGVKVGQTDWAFKSSPTVQTDVPFDGLGSFDIGDGIAYAGSVVMAQGRNVIYGFPGEFWAGTEAGQWMHFYDNGLFVGQFGTPGTFRNRSANALAGFTGNAFFPTLVSVDSRPGSLTPNQASDNGETYLWADDKSNHSGVARWHVLGANSIQVQEGLLEFNGGPVDLQPLTPPVPAPPSRLTAVPGNGKVTVSWTPINGVSSYDVKYSTTSGGPYTVVPSIGNSTYTQTGLTNGNAYYFVVSVAGSPTNSNEVTAFPFATVGIAGHYAKGPSEHLKVSSIAPNSGNPALTGLPGVLGPLARTAVGRSGYVIYNWIREGSQEVVESTPIPYNSSSATPGPITVKIGENSQWRNQAAYEKNVFDIDGIRGREDAAGSSGALELSKNTSGSIDIEVPPSDTREHYVTVFSSPYAARQRKFTIRITPANQSPSPSNPSYSVDDPDGRGDNHVFQFVFTGSVKLTVENGDVVEIGDSGGAAVQAIFVD